MGLDKPTKKSNDDLALMVQIVAGLVSNGVVYPKTGEDGIILLAKKLLLKCKNNLQR